MMNPLIVNSNLMMTTLTSYSNLNQNKSFLNSVSNKNFLNLDAMSFRSWVG